MRQQSIDCPVRPFSLDAGQDGGRSPALGSAASPRSTQILLYGILLVFSEVCCMLLFHEESSVCFMLFFHHALSVRVLKSCCCCLACSLRESFSQRVLMISARSLAAGTVCFPKHHTHITFCSYMYGDYTRTLCFS